MKVTRIAETIVLWSNLVGATDGAYHPSNEIVQFSDDLAEFAGRACYQSFERKNPETRSNKDYLRSTVAEKGHESITAHASVTYYITGVSRALTHEMIRHRFLAFSELSQRYVDMNEVDYAVPPAFGAEELTHLHESVKDSMEVYDGLVDHLVYERGFSRKKAREAARAVLPSAIETRIVVSGNIRAWRDFLRQRWSVHADAEIRMLAGLILEDLRQIAPNSIADIPEEPYA